MWTITNILRTASIYTRGYISRKYFSYRVVNGKFRPISNSEFKDVLDLYDEVVLSCWGFVGQTWSENKVDEAYMFEVARHRRLFKMYPPSEWDLSKVNDTDLIQKWDIIKRQVRTHVNGAY